MSFRNHRSLSVVVVVGVSVALASCASATLLPPWTDATPPNESASSTLPVPVSVPPIGDAASPIGGETSPADSASSEPAPEQVELIVDGPGPCGGLAPIPGCLYTVVEWLAGTPMMDVGGDVKIIFWDPAIGQDEIGFATPRECNEAGTDTFVTMPGGPAARYRVRGTPCKWSPNYLLCLCGPDDFAVREGTRP